VVRGTVRTTAPGGGAGSGLAGAEVVVTPVRPAGAPATLVVAQRQYTTDDGSFRVVGIPAGRATVAVRRVGYRPRTLEIDVPGTAPVALTLEQIPQQVAAVVVRERQRGPYTGWLQHFNRRRDAGFGRFLGRAEIERQNAIRTTDLLRLMPGVQISSGIGTSAVRMRNANCPPFVWIDGTPATAGYLDVDAFPPGTLDGIEVYNGVGSVPMELRGPRGEERCGVIALWSRMPDSRPRGKKAITAEDLARLVESATVYTAEQVDVAARSDGDHPVTPSYPDSLRRARIPGEALVEFVVDTTGRVEVETLSVVSATHPAFGRAARDAVHSAAFTPAQRQGRLVRQLVQLPVKFEAR
jgi:TonB family protein